MATDTQTQSTRRIAAEQLLAFAAYAVAIWLVTVTSLVGFSMSSGASPALVESVMVTSTLFLPGVLLGAGAVTTTHYLLEREIGVFA